MVKQSQFDKKFVIAAVVVGGSYTLIVVLVGRMLGKDAAGVAGVALTALETALLRQFETLQFRKMSEQESVWVNVPPINFSRISTIAFAFIGAQYLSGVAIALFLEPWFGDWEIIVLFIGAVLFCYFVMSLLLAKAIIRLRYSTVAFAVLITQIVSILVGVVAFRGEVTEALQYGLGPAMGAQGAFCLVFEVVALFGVRLGLPKQPSDKSQIESQTAAPSY